MFCQRCSLFLFLLFLSLSFSCFRLGLLLWEAMSLALAIVKLSCKELNKRRWLMVELRSPEWSPDVQLSEWVGVGGTWLQLMCCAVSRRRVLNFKRQRSDRRSEIGGRRWLRRNDKSRTRTTRKVFQSRGARRGLKRIMLKEDYVEDKSRFELRKHTGVVLLI